MERSLVDETLGETSEARLWELSQWCNQTVTILSILASLTKGQLGIVIPDRMQIKSTSLPTL